LVDEGALEGIVDDNVLGIITGEVGELDGTEDDSSNGASEEITTPVDGASNVSLNPTSFSLAISFDGAYNNESADGTSDGVIEGASNSHDGTEPPSSGRFNVATN
jgi:fructose/tagatose bisphosphate aldolase